MTTEGLRDSGVAIAIIGLAVRARVGAASRRVHKTTTPTSYRTCRKRD